MTLTAPLPTRRRRRRRRRRERPENQRSRPAGSSASRSSSSSLLWLVPIAGVLDHVVPARGPRRHDRLVDRVRASVPVRRVDARQLPAGARRRRIPERVPQQHRGRGARDRHPDHDRRVRRVRVLVDGVPRPVRAVRARRRAPRRAAADGADPDPAAVHRRRRRSAACAIIPGPRAERHVPRRLARAHRVRAAARDLPACATTSARCRRRSSSRRRSTAPTTSRSSGGSSCRCRSPRSPRSRSSSSSGCGTTCSSRTCSSAARSDNRVITIALANLVGSATARTGICSPPRPSSR